MRLTATNVGKKIKGKTVLSNIDLDLKSGNIYGFVGPNGSGKTMLFRALSGLMSVTSGVVKLDEKIVRKAGGKIAFILKANLAGNFADREICQNQQFFCAGNTGG